MKKCAYCGNEYPHSEPDKCNGCGSPNIVDMNGQTTFG